MVEEKITETFVVDRIVEFLYNKENANWHKEKTKKADLHHSGVDIKLVGGKEIVNIFLLNVKGNHMQKVLILLIEKVGYMLLDK